MSSFMRPLSAASLIVAGALAITNPATAQQTIKIGVPTSVQLQVGRDTQNAAKLAAEEINAKGGVLGRKLEIVVADETENPEQGIAAIKKLTADEKVNVLIGGYTSGVTLAQLPHISSAKTIYIGVGAASPAITAKVKSDYDNYKYIFRAFPINAAHQARALVDFINGKLKGELKMTKIAIVGENAKWVQDLVPILKKGATDGGTEVKLAEFFDTSTSDFSPLFAKVKDSGAQYLIVVLSHASSDIFVKQWHDAQVPIPIGGIDVKSQDADFFTRVSGKANAETVGMFAIRAPLTPKTIPFWDEFVKRFGTAPVYTGIGAYDAVYIYADAVKRANSIEPDAVIKELEKTDHVGIAGKLVFDELHDVKTGPGMQNLLFVQWQKNGERVVVWPKEAATGPMISPPWMSN
ncbi:ABC transporter substrate-binding protein [Tardiphaga sp. vice352]|uniref:ABC transporter substrate-binding protein n=1 Tax=unclassified Tardiphaga TaxID=2631404 RepID=UPI0011624F20|nr:MULTISPECIES: ABC transporter substrate-binding protein [unclassified Tardiphaga]QDM15286.1 ABC transporter substrate-binding protein [Tardiphaga sp. vice278]QDM20369.1 ABC transporter substrate-binding protein [Tardiphaga sp. vice154]QDM25455.1 ABC transporter substrate-binding protein [Tardiphaga sp. vice304]QDM30664.1 ABC transporter substrate-binding protein [Tardiphaga sp. vice352]